MFPKTLQGQGIDKKRQPSALSTVSVVVINLRKWFPSRRHGQWRVLSYLAFLVIGTIVVTTTTVLLTSYPTIFLGNI